MLQGLLPCYHFNPWVPQKRERIFIVGFKDQCIEFDFDQLAIPEGDGPTLGTILDNPFMDTPRVKRFSIGCERVIGCSHLSGLKGAAI